MKFVFLLTIWQANAEPQVYVEGFGLTGEDCIAAMESYVLHHPNQEKGAASCEVDMGQPWDELPVSGVFN